MRVSRGALVFTGLALGSVLVATLRPAVSREATSWVNCVICGERGWADALVNVLLFVAPGVGLRLLGVTARRAILAAALGSATIELAQLAIPGRDPSLGDVLFNTGGATAGWIGAALAPSLLRLGTVTAAWLSLAVAAGVAGTVSVTGWLLQPSYPNTVYYGQWTPNLGHLEWYRGRVRSVFIGPLPVRSRRIANSDSVRTLLRIGAPIQIRATAGPRLPALGSLFSVYDQERAEVILIGPDRDDLVFRYRTRASALRLDRPDLRLHRAMTGLAPGDSLLVRVWSPEPRRHCLAVNAREACGLGFSVGGGWGLLYYVESLPARIKQLLDAVWVGILALPMGLWLRARWASALAAGVLGATLWILPGWVGLLPAGPTLSAAAAVGLVAGHVLARAGRATRNARLADLGGD